MELLQLQYFRKAARLQHISLAAEQLHIAQPALSQSIKRLERELGVPLFDRKGRHIVLNEYGKILLKHTEQIFSSLESAQSEISKLQNQMKNTISLCVKAASALMPMLLEEFHSLYPNVIFHISQDTASGEFDFRLHSGISFPDDANSEVLLKEGLSVALHRDNPLADKESLSFQDLSDNSFMILEPGNDLYHTTLFYFQKAGFRPKTSLYCSNPSMLRDFLDRNYGIALLPEKTWNLQNNDAIVLKKLTDFSCFRYIILTRCRPLSANPALFREFRNLTVSFFNSLQNM